MYLNFTVTIYLSNSSLDIVIPEFVTEKQFKRMKKCAKNDPFSDYTGIKRLLAKIRRKALEIAPHYTDEIDADSVPICTIAFPDEVIQSI